MEPDWLDFRIASFILKERSKVENQTCPQCRDIATNSTKNCPVCGVRWAGDTSHPNYAENTREQLADVRKRRLEFRKMK